MKLVLVQPQHILFVLSIILSAPMLKSLLPFSYQIMPHGLQIIFRAGSNKKFVRSLQSIGYRIINSVDLLRLKSSISYASLARRQNNIFDILSSKQVKQIGQILMEKGCNIVAQFEQKKRQNKSEWVIVLCVKNELERICCQIDKCAICLDIPTRKQLILQYKQSLDRLLMFFESRFLIDIQKVSFNQRCFLLFKQQQTYALFTSLILKYQQLTSQLQLQVVLNKLEYHLALSLISSQFPVQFIQKKGIQNQKRGVYSMITKRKYEKQLKSVVQIINGTKHRKIQIQTAQKVENNKLACLRKQLAARFQKALIHVTLSPLWKSKQRICFEFFGEVKQSCLKQVINEVIGRQLSILSIKQKQEAGSQLHIEHQQLQSSQLQGLLLCKSLIQEDLSSLDFSRVMKDQYFT